MLGLYIFDRNLRILVMEALERIEVAVRSRWGNALAVRHGSHAYLKPELFKYPGQHAGDLAKITADMEKSKEPFVVHPLKRFPFNHWALVRF